MSNPVKKREPFNAGSFTKKLAAFVAANPLLATRAYANAAARFRHEAATPGNAAERLILQSMANEFERLAAESIVPETDPHYGEVISLFADGVPGTPTQFDGIVSDLAASKMQEDGTPNGDLAAANTFEQLQQQRSNDVAVPVRVVPASVRPETILGDEVAIQRDADPTAGTLQEAPVIRWDGYESEAMPMNIALYPVQTNGSGGITYPNGTKGISQLNYRPYARITWGSGRGRPNQAFVDIGRGIQITLSGYFVYVNVGMDAYPLNAGILPGSMIVTGSLAFYTASRFAPALRTIYADNLTNGQIQTSVIPEFATSIEMVSGTAPSGFTVRILDEAGNTIDAYDTSLPRTRGNAMMLPDDAYQVAIINNSGFIASLRVVFGLSL